MLVLLLHQVQLVFFGRWRMVTAALVGGDFRPCEKLCLAASFTCHTLLNWCSMGHWWLHQTMAPVLVRGVARRSAGCCLCKLITLRLGDAIFRSFAPPAGLSRDGHPFMLPHALFWDEVYQRSLEVLCERF